jgi:hypothetical protein
MKLNRQWIKYAAIGAGISLAGGLILHVPYPQMAVSAALAASLVFSGFLMRTKGRPEKEVES